MNARTSLIVLFFFLCCRGTLQAQFKEGDPGGVELGESSTQRWQVGVEVTAIGGPCSGLIGYIPIPVDWPEQTVRVVEEDISPEAKVSYQNVNNTVRLMVVRIGSLPGAQTARALVTQEIERRTMLPPEAPSRFVLPDPKRMDRAIRPYLGPSPLIETRHPKIRAVAKQFAQQGETAWEKVEAIYDWVRDHVEYKNGPIKGALAALEDETGDCEELTSLFIAICRVNDIPARTVWVPGHCYPEFYLEDEEGKGHWFPCQAAGSREFGGITETRPILQKGDDFRPPWNRRDRQRYLAEHLTGAGGRPQCRFVRKLLSE